jgi:NADPH:quinone reductase-like Zn-dependent oxidoreductase
VLIHGGAGGVGHLAIQIARARGAAVFATGSSRQEDIISRLGGTFIDHTAETVADYVSKYTQGAGFDVVYDTVGGAVLDASFQAVRRFGHVVSCLGWGTHSLAPLSFRAATYSGVFTLLPLLTGEGREHHGDILREVSRLGIRPIVDPRRFRLESVDEAYRAVASGSAAGKIVVDIAD